MLTLLSVKFGSARLLERNIRLVRALNPGVSYRWVVVNNDFDVEFAARDQGVLVVPGAAPPGSTPGDRGSAHHAAGLMAGLPHVTSRYLLLLDHDFFVIRRGWLRTLLAHVQARRLALFGSVWHPRWSYQPRDFPSVHFLLVDLEQVPTHALDFRPDFGSDRLDALISDPRLPLPPDLRTLWQVGRFRDTGWRLRRQFQSSGLRSETLVPHFDLPAALAAAPPLHRLAQRWLPAGRRMFPEAGSVTTDSFLRERAPLAYQYGWEEFFWQGEPFAAHMRSVGRRGAHAAQDETELDRLLKSVEGED